MEALAALGVMGLAGLIMFLLGRWPGMRQPERRRLIAGYLQLHQDAKGLVSYDAEWLDDATWQFYGDVAGGTIKPGMRMVLPDKQFIVIKEVYADHKTPDQPSQQAYAGAQDVSVVVELQGINDSSYFAHYYQQNPIILLEIPDIDTRTPIDQKALAPTQPTISRASRIASMITSGILIAIFAILAGSAVYEARVAKEQESEKPASLSNSSRQIEVALKELSLQMEVPDKMRLIRQQESSALYGVMPQNQSGVYAGEVEVGLYEATSSDFTDLSTAFQTANHRNMLESSLSKYCATPNVSTEVRAIHNEGVSSAHQTAFTCSEQSKGTDMGGYVVLGQSGNTGFKLVVVAQRSLWQSERAIWDGIVPSLVVYNLQ